MWIDGDRIGHKGDVANGSQFARIVGEPGVEPGRHGQTTRTTHHQRIAVRRGFRRQLDTDGAAGTAAIVDDHRVTPGLGELLANDPGNDVVRAARRERHDDLDRFGRISRRSRLRPYRHRQRRTG